MCRDGLWLHKAPGPVTSKGPRPTIFPVLSLSNAFTVHCKEKSVKFTEKYRPLWLPEFYHEKYGSNILGYTELFKFTVEKKVFH